MGVCCVLAALWSPLRSSPPALGEVKVASQAECVKFLKSVVQTWVFSPAKPKLGFPWHSLGKAPPRPLLPRSETWNLPDPSLSLTPHCSHPVPHQTLTVLSPEYASLSSHRLYSISTAVTSPTILLPCPHSSNPSSRERSLKSTYCKGFLLSLCKYSLMFWSLHFMTFIIYLMNHHQIHFLPLNNLVCFGPSPTQLLFLWGPTIFLTSESSRKLCSLLERIYSLLRHLAN